MNVTFMSTTLISGWQLCPDRAWEQYEVRNELGNDTMGSNPTRFGSVVHDTAEEVHNRHMRGDPIPDYLDLFDKFWRKRDLADFPYYELGQSLISDFLRRTIEERRGTTIATELGFVLDLVSGGVWLTDGLEDKEVATVVKTVIASGGVPVKSMIDRIDRVGDDLDIFDYKTNAVPFTRDEVENSLQLGIYTMAAAAIYPWAGQITATFDMVRHGRFPHVFPTHKLQAMRRFLINLWHQIAGAEVAQPTLNNYCSWCHKRGNCPVYQQALEDTIPAILTEETANPEGLEWLHDQFEGLKRRKKLIEERLNELDAQISAALIQSKGRPILLSDRELYLQPNTRGEYPADKVYELFAKKRSLVMLRDVMTIPKGKLDAKLRNIPFADEVQKLLVQNHTKSSIKARSLNPQAVEEDT